MEAQRIEIMEWVAGSTGPGTALDPQLSSIPPPPKIAIPAPYPTYLGTPRAPSFSFLHSPSHQLIYF